jgi:hypothetical protein
VARGSEPLILLAGASVLIDFGYLDCFELLVRTSQPVEVLDAVLEECDSPKQPHLLSFIRAAGIITVETKLHWRDEAKKYRDHNPKPILSEQDALNLHYALTECRTFLVNERPLRESCLKYDIPHYGTLRILEIAFEDGMLLPEEFIEYLEKLVRLRRRPPIQEVNRLLQLLKQ